MMICNVRPVTALLIGMAMVSAPALSAEWATKEEAQAMVKKAVSFIKEQGGAKEVHVRVACPPIVAPCFYGIDMSTVGELFAPRFMAGKVITVAEQEAMARQLGADSLFYLPLEAVARCIGLPDYRLCRACLTGEYPTAAGERLYQLALRDDRDESHANGRTYERAAKVCS